MLVAFQDVKASGGAMLQNDEKQRNKREKDGRR